MANRSFSTEIVCSDAFYDLPISSQALYFQLGMYADDFGFVNNAKTIIKLSGTNVGDLEQLVVKKFVLLLDKGLVLIKGWAINNGQIENATTNYIEELSKLYYDENYSYTSKITDKPCSVGSNPPLIEKESLNNNNNIYSLGTMYSNRINRSKDERERMMNARAYAHEPTEKIDGYSPNPLTDLLINSGYIEKESRKRFDGLLNYLLKFNTMELLQEAVNNFISNSTNYEYIYNPYAYFKNGLDKNIKELKQKRELKVEEEKPQADDMSDLKDFFDM